MIKTFIEFTTNIILLALINNEALLRVLTEVQNILAIVAVRLLWIAYEKFAERRKKKRNERIKKTS